jgi:hypothetical protein
LRRNLGSVCAGREKGGKSSRAVGVSLERIRAERSASQHGYGRSHCSLVGMRCAAYPLERRLAALDREAHALLLDAVPVVLVRLVVRGVVLQSRARR